MKVRRHGGGHPYRDGHGEVQNRHREHRAQAVPKAAAELPFGQFDQLEIASSCLLDSLRSAAARVENFAVSVFGSVALLYADLCGRSCGCRATGIEAPISPYKCRALVVIRDLYFALRSAFLSAGIKSGSLGLTFARHSCDSRKTDAAALNAIDSDGSPAIHPDLSRF